MSKLNLRKTAYSVEEIFHEGGPARANPLRRAAALAIIENPFAGRYEPDIQWFMEDLKPLGLQMAEKLIALLGGPDQIEGYGKGAMIGEDGELEHGALWHAPGGYAMRQLIEPSNAIVPSSCLRVTGKPWCVVLVRSSSTSITFTWMSIVFTGAVIMSLA